LVKSTLSWIKKRARTRNFCTINTYTNDYAFI
jgi:hypothetical protein